jgi:Flp pilus assembly protein TadG
MKALANVRNLHAARIGAGERGAAMVELAFAMPIALMVLVAILEYSLYLNNSLILENSTSLAAQYLSLNRGAADPCLLAMKAFENSTPSLTPSNLTFSFTLNGTSYPGLSGTLGASECTAGSAQLTQGKLAMMKVTYSCQWGLFNSSVLPFCPLVAQITEVVQ